MFHGVLTVSYVDTGYKSMFHNRELFDSLFVIWWYLYVGINRFSAKDFIVYANTDSFDILLFDELTLHGMICRAGHVCASIHMCCYN